ncbi:MAG: alpha/beta hydrolase [Porphyromonas sp.]|nr:alpha/beta hydrolase [Porphyromonas sp.]
MQTSYTTSPIAFVEVQGRPIAYRRIGRQDASPIIYINHLAANLDNCDPVIMDGLAQHFCVISFDYPGIGHSAGDATTSVEEMARQTVAFVRALGYSRVHLLGLSLGGFVAQAILQQVPELVESVILAGTGPAGDRGIARVPQITYYDMLRGFLTGRDPRYYLFFPATEPARREARAFIERTSKQQVKDKPTRLATLRRQLRAVVAWGQAAEQDFAHLSHRVWVVNGDNDRMVPTAGSHVLAERIPNATLTIYEGAGHGAIFQEAERFVEQATAFYKANDITKTK